MLLYERVDKMVITYSFVFNWETIEAYRKKLISQVLEEKNTYFFLYKPIV